MYNRSPDLLITDIIITASKILKYTKDLTYEEFIKDRLTVDAVLRNFDIITEAQRSLPEDFKALHSEINWHQIGEFRNTILIDYFGIDFSSIWHIKNTFYLL